MTQPINARGSIEERLTLETRFLNLINRTGNRHNIMQEALGIIRDHFGATAVGLRIKQADRAPLTFSLGFSTEKGLTDGLWCCFGSTCTLCRSVLTDDKTGPSLASRSARGSLWTTSASQLRTAKARYCMEHAIESAAIIPVRTDQSIYGVLLLIDERAKCFAKRDIDFLEGLASSLAVCHERDLFHQQLLEAQKMEAIGTLTSGLAHDFNNILTALIGHAELVALDLPSGSEASESQREVLHAAERASKLIRQMATVGRRIAPKRQEIDLAQIVIDACSLLRASLPSTISIDMRLDKNCGVVLGDGGQLHQVVMNLGTNAFHAMRAQAEAPTKHDKPALLTIELQRQESRDGKGDLWCPPRHALKLCVSDTGCGMSQAVLERIFDPYFTTKEPGEGTGLGLAMVQSILTTHDATIAVESQPKMGTTVCVTFPAHQSCSQGKKIETAQESIIEGNEHLLLVDDEAAILRALSHGLKRLGYRTTTALSAKDALSALSNDDADFDLIVSDITMPDMLGTEMVQRLRANGHTMPVILFSGRTTPTAPEKSKQVGAQAFIAKPVSVNTLAKAIRKCVKEATP